MDHKILSVFMVFTLLPLIQASAIPLKKSTSSDKLTIRILHTNDMHGSFDETSVVGGPCRPADSVAGKCYGGFARLATLIRAARDEGLKNDVPTFFLNAGDTFTGTDLFKRYHWKIAAKFLNILRPDAASLGNHEFDDGVEDLVKFLNNLTFPVVSANLDVSNEPRLQNLKNLKPSIILNAKGRKIGVIGYLTPDTMKIARTDNIKFLEEIEVIKKEAKQLTSQGCDIIIALGHSGYEFDLRLAEQVEEVDLVIGGHSHSFLYTGPKPSVEDPEGPYPTIVTQASGKKVYVVQAYVSAKYLGDLRIEFDDQGEITKLQGHPVLLTGAVPKADDVEQELQELLKGLRKPLIPVGTTLVTLEGGKICRIRECNIGNLVTDGMVAYNARRYDGKDQWTDAPIAIMAGGSIRSSIARSADNQVFNTDVDAVFPMPDKIYKVNLTGDVMMKAFEHSVHDRIDATRVKHGGVFLQLSGIKLTYNISKPVGSRVVSVKLRSGEKSVNPVYEDLSLTKSYTLLLPSYVYNGGDGYIMFEGLPFTNLSAETPAIFTEQISRTSPVEIGLENRITIVW